MMYYFYPFWSDPARLTGRKHSGTDNSCASLHVVIALAWEPTRPTDALLLSLEIIALELTRPADTLVISQDAYRTSKSSRCIIHKSGRPMEQAAPADAPFISQDTAELWNQQDKQMHHIATQSLQSSLESFLKRWTMIIMFSLARVSFKFPSL